MLGHHQSATVKRHLMAFRWQADDGKPLVVFGSLDPLSSSTKITYKQISK